MKPGRSRDPLWGTAFGRMATLNALMEALDAAATLLALVQRHGSARPSAATVGAALAASAVFLALRSAAS
jgi:hypothetical protein